MPQKSRIVYYGRPKPRKPLPKAPIYFLLAVIVLGALGVGLWYLVNVPSIRIQTISVSGTRTLSPEEIQSRVRGAISGMRWYVFPNDSVFLVSSSRLERALGQTFPRLETISVRKKFPRELAVEVTERSFWGIYCQKRAAIGPCVYVDRLGIAYERFSAFEGSLAPLVHAFEPPRLGAVVVPESLRDFYEGVSRALAGIPVKLISLELATATPRDLRLTLAEGWYLLVPNDSNPQQWVPVLKTVLDQEIGERRSRLEYIDLRFGNKVFYKYR